MKTTLMKFYYRIFCLYLVCLSFMTNQVSMAWPSSFAYENSSLHFMKSRRLQDVLLMKPDQRDFNVISDEEKNKTYANLFVFQSNDTETIKNLIEEHGFLLLRKVFEDEDYYVFRHPKHRRCRRSSKRLLKKITRYPWVKWAAQQMFLHRVRRSLEEAVFNANIYDRIFHLKNKEDKFWTNKLLTSGHFSSLQFNDPLFEKQWYLHNTGQTGAPPENDINVLPVWQSGITGRGVRISVLDDGIYSKSAEVADNYDHVSSEGFLYLNGEVTPIPENSHGTQCAAIAAGVANNKICGVGVAYEAKIGGIRILNGPLTDVQEALALVHALEHVDIYTASWGPNDNGKRVEGPGRLTRMAFQKGVTQGRNGRGAIYVWAAGNGGGYNDNCNLDGYASSPFTLTFGALTEDGFSTFYTEPCAAVIASLYVGGKAHSAPTEKNILKENRKIKVVVPEGRGKCKETFQGTSAAAPMAAGVIALALQANPDLTWRDVQHIIISTSRKPSTGESGWQSNASGYHFHLKLGFGVLDADKMVRIAFRWSPVKPLRMWTSRPNEEIRYILPDRATPMTLVIRKSDMDPQSRIDVLESVIAKLNIIHPRCGDLEIFLQSPSGTVSQILTRRPLDNKTRKFRYWDFLSLHFWGESPDGAWLLKIFHRGTSAVGVLNYFALTLHGTAR